VVVIGFTGEEACYVANGLTVNVVVRLKIEFDEG